MRAGDMWIKAILILLFFILRHFKVHLECIISFLMYYLVYQLYYVLF